MEATNLPTFLKFGSAENHRCLLSRQGKALGGSADGILPCIADTQLYDCEVTRVLYTIDVINVCTFLSRSRFLRFFNVFLIFSTFFIFKKRCQMQSINM